MAVIELINVASRIGMSTETAASNELTLTAGADAKYNEREFLTLIRQIQFHVVGYYGHRRFEYEERTYNTSVVKAP